MCRRSAVLRTFLPPLGIQSRYGLHTCHRFGSHRAGPALRCGAWLRRNAGLYGICDPGSKLCRRRHDPVCAVAYGRRSAFTGWPELHCLWRGSCGHRRFSHGNAVLWLMAAGLPLEVWFATRKPVAAAASAAFAAMILGYFATASGGAISGGSYVSVAVLVFYAASLVARGFASASTPSRSGSARRRWPWLRVTCSSRSMPRAWCRRSIRIRQSFWAYSPKCWKGRR